MLRALVVSPAADRRLDRAAAWLDARATHERVRILGATFEGPAELVRRAAQRRGAMFGWETRTLASTAMLLARPELAAADRAPLGALGLEAIAAQVVDRLRAAGELGRLQPVASFPGLPRALARTIAELRLGGVDPASLQAPPRSAHEALARVHELYEQELERAHLADDSLVLAAAIRAARAATDASPMMLLDVSVRTPLERDLCAALAATSVDVIATVPEGDVQSLEHLQIALGVLPERPSPDAGGSLRRLQAELFSGQASREPSPGNDVVLLSAPGESRECMEIARLVQREAARGVPFDRMAILLRAPAQYRTHVEEALRRASVPAHFARGTVEPDPSGRAFAALLACGAERLSARRFAEYMSLGQIPDLTDDGAPPDAAPADARWVAPDLPSVARPDEESSREPSAPAPVSTGSPAGAPAHTAIRAPRRWERLVVQSAVIGGLDRWEARLAAFERALEAEARDLSNEPRALYAARDLVDLGALRRFAMPLLRALAALPTTATWSVWLDALGGLATRALRNPARVLSLLAELHPMAGAGPVDLTSVRLVLERRLTALLARPRPRRGGAVFVAPVEGARGLSFEVVFVPGLAERLFPQKVAEDPVLRDRDRASLRRASAEVRLETNDDRVAEERLALRVAVGAARARLYLSYPRVDLEQSRPRVPSFYGLEVLRAAEGALPGFDALARRAESVGSARIGWPAPALPDLAVDDAEYDLALLEGLFRLPEAVSAGSARYLLSANAHLARALRFRARRWTIRKWAASDGLVDPRGRARAALDRHAFAARTYAATTLERFAACPYRFFLYAVHRLAPREDPEAIDALDARQRGALVHAALHALGEALDVAGLLPVTPENIDRAKELLDPVITEVAARFEGELAPAIARTWDDGIAAARADLGEWLRKAASESASGYRPWKFELAFGATTPVLLDTGVKLAGSIDLVERTAAGTLRATDYKTGKPRDLRQGAAIAGGLVLQPLLYATTLEKLFPEMPVDGGRLYYCTSAGGFDEAWLPLDDHARAALAQATGIIGDAITQGFLPAAPARDACATCDYRGVCGPYEETRAARKSVERLASLRLLRSLP